MATELPTPEAPLVIDPDDLTLGEVTKLEVMAGKGMDTLFGEGGFKGPALTALATIVIQRDDPDFTYKDAEGIKMTAIDMGSDDDKDAAGND